MHTMTVTRDQKNFYIATLTNEETGKIVCETARLTATAAMTACAQAANDMGLQVDQVDLHVTPW